MPSADQAAPKDWYLPRSSGYGRVRGFRRVCGSFDVDTGEMRVGECGLGILLAQNLRRQRGLLKSFRGEVSVVYELLSSSWLASARTVMDIHRRSRPALRIRGTGRVCGKRPAA
jgi:hypothetical protein